MNPLPYVAEFGPSLSSSAKFATFAEALAFHNGYLAGTGRLIPPRDGVRIRNIDRADGSEDGRPDGLTDDEREQLSNAT